MSTHAPSFSLALDKSADICDAIQLSIVIRGSDDNFNILEEIIGLESLHGEIRGSDIFDEKKFLSNKSVIKFTCLLRVCIDGARPIIGRTAGTVALRERYLDRHLLKYH